MGANFQYRQTSISLCLTQNFITSQPCAGWAAFLRPVIVPPGLGIFLGYHSKRDAWKSLTSSLLPALSFPFAVVGQKKCLLRSGNYQGAPGYLGSISLSHCTNSKLLFQASERMEHNCPEVHLRNIPVVCLSPK